MKKRLGIGILLMVVIWNVSAKDAICEADSSGSRMEVNDEIVALQKIVVTANRLETPLREIASSITIINENDIAEKQNRMVSDVLRGVPGLSVVQSGGAGMLTNVYMRGAKTGHTLVLVDGIEMNDPMSIGRAYDFANLTTDNIDRIEVIRGPQSTLWGSDAMGGVINILTKRGSGKPSFFVTGEGGSQKTFRETLGVNGSWQWADYSLTLSRIDTEGISSAGESYGNMEKDGYKNTSFSSRLGLHPRDNLTIGILSRFTDSDAEIDFSAGVGGDDPNNRAHSSQFSFKSQADLLLFNDLWHQKFGFSIMNQDRNNTNGHDTNHPFDSLYTSFGGQMLKFEWQNSVRLHKTNTLTGGGEIEVEKGDHFSYYEGEWGGFIFSGESKIKNVKSTIFAGYLQDQIRLGDCFFTTVGFRIDYNHEIRKRFTYRIASTYHIKPIFLKINATLGTGFKAPSLYQLYSEYGDSTLIPEKNLGWDAGIEQSLLDNRILWGVTYFSTIFYNMIDFDFATYKYDNIGEAESQGIEVYTGIKPLKGLKLTGNYTYTDAKNTLTKKVLHYRPKHKVTGGLSYTILEKATIGMDVVYVRDVYGNDGLSSALVQMSDYKLVNLSVAYDITEYLSLFGRIHNVLGEQYEEVIGYGTADISGFAGFKLSF